MKNLLIAALILASLALPAPATAQTANDRVLTIFGKDPCPKDTICVRAPEQDRFRIPKQFRNGAAIAPENQSWAKRAEQVDLVGRSGTGSCSPSGPGGWTGCYLQQMQAARADRKAASEEASSQTTP